ncbi:MAG: hypothetical protein AAFQ22_08785 [Pseudomonadota bacterium]
MNRLFKPAFASWIYAWAVTTFISAAIIVGSTGQRSVAEWLGSLLNVADVIPPFAKISFGMTMAIIFWVLGRYFGNAPWTLVVSGLAVPVSFSLAVLVYPLGYYAPEVTGDFWPLHFAASCFGGLVYAVSLAFGRKKAATSV